jgi:hypothetical protein
MLETKNKPAEAKSVRIMGKMDFVFMNYGSGELEEGY